LAGNRQAAIEASLRREGVASVQFINISPHKSMFDLIDLSHVRLPVDLALVAAGIGAVNILQQLEELSVPCIDSGISMECLINAQYRMQRPFLLSDAYAAQTGVKVPIESVFVTQ